MAKTLPRSIRLRLQQSLGQWRQWELQPTPATAPVLVKPLGQGLSNYSFLVVADQQHLVLRLDGASPVTNGLSRQAEWRVLQHAHAAGIAPLPRYCNPELGVLVCDHLPPQLKTTQSLAELGALLRSIHSLPAIHLRLDLGERCRRYEHALQGQASSYRAAIAPLAPALGQLLPAAEALAGPVVLCHNDLLRANRLYSDNRLWAVDWEYAAMGSAWFDLAAIIAGDEWQARAGTQLLGHYLQRAPLPDEVQALAVYDCVYRYLELLWHALYPDTLPAPHWEQKRTTLVARLAAI
ncbi:MAG TPA: phosphotransferase [Kineobactrum sp.]